MTTCSFVVSCASNTLRFCKSFQHKNLYTSPALLHCWSKAHLELFRSLLVVKPSARQRYRPSRTLSSSSTIFSGERNCKCCTTTEEEHKVQEPPFSGKSESFNDWTTRDSAKGWIRSIRDQKKFAFLVVNDGSCLSGLQIFVESTLQSYEEVKSLLTGSSVSVSGKLVHSIGKGQFYELQAEEVRILGDCDASYPLQKKRHSFEYLRRIAHLRPRTNTFGAVMRVRSMLAFATHCFFQENGFVYIHSPIITSSDCEGAGEMFRVLTEPGKSLNDARREDAKNFFGIPTFLTVSGQLSAEAYSCALRDVYTFGPAFRAEYSNTTKHLSEFWMVEPEMAFANLQDDMNNAESYVKFVIQYVLEKCKEDIDFFDRFIQNGLKSRLHKYIEKPFARISYSEAVEILQNSGNPFQFPVSWGEDLATEHERYLAEEYFDHPVFVYNYPAAIKAFYMKNNDHDSVSERIENYWWYLDLRRFGSVPHAGYGLGFERLVLFVTGMENIRDVIPFPRFPGSAEF
ncbi:Asparagine--tRNA ligase, chloroplastic/mitochondrial [Galdieria sulphuraria]|nr:Asparagine--tRNA ligase, chloroplastic/mitochondrial [Galdieria sulphuraria]